MQPSQKMFESLVWHALHHFDPKSPVFVESESKKIGNLRTPEALIDAMWAARCIHLETPTALRVTMLMQEYDHFVRDPAALGNQLDCLVSLHGHERINQWKSMSVAGDELTVTIAANDGAAQPAEVWLCPLSRSVPVAIGRGENHGRTITYTNVVKRWVKLGDWNGKSETFNVPLNDLHTADVDSVAVLVQSGVASAPKMMLGAAQASLK